MHGELYNRRWSDGSTRANSVSDLGLASGGHLTEPSEALRQHEDNSSAWGFVPKRDYTGTMKHFAMEHVLSIHKLEYDDHTADGIRKDAWVNTQHPLGGIMPADSYVVSPVYVVGGSLDKFNCMNIKKGNTWTGHGQVK